MINNIHKFSYSKVKWCLYMFLYICLWRTSSITDNLSTLPEVHNCARLGSFCPKWTQPNEENKHRSMFPFTGWIQVKVLRFVFYFKFHMKTNWQIWKAYSLRNLFCIQIKFLMSITRNERVSEKYTWCHLNLKLDYDRFTLKTVSKLLVSWMLGRNNPEAFIPA